MFDVFDSESNLHKFVNDVNKLKSEKSKTKIYKRKSDLILAIKYTGENLDELYSFLKPFGCIIHAYKGNVYVETVDGFTITLETGDYIINDNGKFYPCVQEVFDEKFVESNKKLSDKTSPVKDDSSIKIGEFLVIDDIKYKLIYDDTKNNLVYFIKENIDVSRYYIRTEADEICQYWFNYKIPDKLKYLLYSEKGECPIFIPSKKQVKTWFNTKYYNDDEFFPDAIALDENGSSGTWWIKASSIDESPKFYLDFCGGAIRLSPAMDQHAVRPCFAIRKEEYLKNSKTFRIIEK